MRGVMYHRFENYFVTINIEPSVWYIDYLHITISFTNFRLPLSDTTNEKWCKSFHNVFLILEFYVTGQNFVFIFLYLV